MQQLREDFPFDPAAKFLILDHDSKYGIEAPAATRSIGHETDTDGGRLSLAEWGRGTIVGSCRHELLDHMITII